MLARFLDSYSENLILAIGLWPMVSFVLTLPILAFLYHRDGRIKPSSAIMAYLSVLYAMGIVCFTLYPLPSGSTGLGIDRGVQPQLDPLAFIGDIRKDGLRAVFQLLFNIAFFMPLGFIAGRFFRWKLVPSVVFGFAVSLLVETAQLTGLFGIYQYAYRTFDVDDLICNTLGALGGYGIAHLTNRFMPERSSYEVSAPAQPTFLRRCVALWIDTVLLGTVLVILLTLVQVVFALCGLYGPGRAEELHHANIIVESAVLALGVAGFILMEGIIPWLRNGRTIGGNFIHMTCETKERQPVLRVVFYILRVLILGLMFAFSFFAVPILALFYLIKRRMPYDYVPVN